MASKSSLGGTPVTQGQSGAGVQGMTPSASAALPTANPPPMNIGLGSQGAGGKGGSSPFSNYVQQGAQGVTGSMPPPGSPSGQNYLGAPRGPGVTGQMPPPGKPGGIASVAGWRSAGMPARPMSPGGERLQAMLAAGKPGQGPYMPGAETRGVPRQQLTPMSAEEADRRFAASQGIAALPPTG